MKISSEKQSELSQIKKLHKDFVFIVENPGQGLSGEVYNQIRDYIKPVLVTYGLLDVADSLIGWQFDLIDKLVESKEEIDWVFNEHILSFDPLYKHKLFLKKISEMTGYEYQRYLKFINTENSNLQIS
ncbi:hypothetical protein [Dyadobacter sp. 32]|uniref:hypothetical protein n=1 Tax=Dyadobacter sp. 32 TaxID=538966 RepID=UPI0011EFD486